MKKLANKSKHALIKWEVIARDFIIIQQMRLQPNAQNQILVENENEKRIYGIHADPNPKGQHRLFPLSGDGVHSMTGSQLFNSYTDFESSNHSSFISYLEEKNKAAT